MSKRTVISLVSFYNGAGKTFTANYLSNKLNFCSVSFAAPLYEASERLVHDFNGASKDATHPVLGVSFRELNNIIAAALHERNPEIAVYRTKDTIRLFMMQEQNIVLHDIRRECDFNWVDQISRENNYEHHIVEVYPVGRFLEKCTPDTWKYGYRGDGEKAWEGRTTKIVFNDATEEYLSIWLQTLVDSLGVDIKP